MKNTLKQFILICCLLLSLIAKAQDDPSERPTSSINMIARYTKNSVEMRFFPDKKQVLNYGFKNGFIIERADITVIPEGVDDINKLSFVKVGQTTVYTQQQWSDALSISGTEIKKDLELSKDFFDSMDKNKGGTFNFEDGIKDMNEQKSKEDFEYLIVVMNAIKCKEAAQALGLSYIDKSVEANKRYIYRIKLNGESKTYDITNMPFTIETKSEIFKLRKIYVKPGDTKLSFMWDETDMVSGTIVERKNSKTGTWDLLTQAPEYNINEGQRKGYFDEKLTNYVKYEYRFYGNNPFGERILFGTAKGMPIDLTPPKTPLYISAKHSKPDEILIKWDINKPEDGDLKGFFIGRGNSNNGKFNIVHDKLLAKETRSYIDKKFSKDETNYYVIQAIDTSGNVSSTIPAYVTIIDSIAPIKPKFLSGKIDSLGVVTLNIDKNLEKDLMGYRLFRSNSDKHEFSVIREGFSPNDSIQKPIQLVFKDTVTLNSLTPYIYYRIKALDQNFNQSEFSDILKVKRPDKIAPTTPVFKNIISRKEEIELEFVLSQSEDVVEQYLYRKLEKNAKWELIATLKNDQKIYIDKQLKTNGNYFYSLRAKDDSNLFSQYAASVYGKPYDDGVRPPIEDFIFKKEKDKIILNWNYKAINKDTFFVIFKNDSKENLIQYKNTSELSFEEKSDSKTNKYAVKVYTKDGGQSVLSKIVTVTNN
ncbi:MAG: hypothetical protein EXR20_08315 [Bacteroidetes bacterium]|nr:hypothetical protein [Bacteroidota bacterium]